MINRDKLIKTLGVHTVEEMDAMDPTELKKVIVDASGAMKQVKEELEANPAYQDAKANVSALSQGKRDVDKRQKARIQYALEAMEGLGSLDETGLAAFYSNRSAFLAKAAKKATADLNAMDSAVQVQTEIDLHVEGEEE